MEPDHASHKNNRSLQVAMMGPGGCGKSALTIRFMYDEFIVQYEPTKSDAYQKTVNVAAGEFKLSIFDTAGQEDYEFLRDNYIRNSQAFVLVFSHVDKESFDALDDFFDKIFQLKQREDIVVLMVGNKKDLVGEEAAIPIADIELKAHKLNVTYFDTSAKDNLNVQQIFEFMTTEYAKIKQYTPVTDETKKKKKKSKRAIFRNCHII